MQIIGPKSGVVSPVNGVGIEVGIGNGIGVGTEGGIGAGDSRVAVGALVNGAGSGVGAQERGASGSGGKECKVDNSEGLHYCDCVGCRVALKDNSR